MQNEVDYFQKRIIRTFALNFWKPIVKIDETYVKRQLELCPVATLKQTPEFVLVK